MRRILLVTLGIVIGVMLVTPNSLEYLKNKAEKAFTPENGRKVYDAGKNLVETIYNMFND